MPSCRGKLYGGWGRVLGEGNLTFENSVHENMYLKSSVWNAVLLRLENNNSAAFKCTSGWPQSLFFSKACLYQRLLSLLKILLRGVIFFLTTLSSSGEKHNGVSKMNHEGPDPTIFVFVGRSLLEDNLVWQTLCKNRTLDLTHSISRLTS